jgi:hypothetical protein
MVRGLVVQAHKSCPVGTCAYANGYRTSNAADQRVSLVRGQSPVGWWGFGCDARCCSAFDFGLGGVSVARLVELGHRGL